ncbi:type II secretion system F family protein [Natronospora cellulosivora (SeqCode)]
MSPVYDYQAVNNNGEKISGSIEVENSSMVARQLKENGYFVTSVKEATAKKEVNSLFERSKKVKTKDLTTFSQQFSAMIDAGISLVECMNIMYQETDHPRMKEVIRGIQEDIETGTGLSEAMKKFPDVFPPLYCQLVKAGEAGGVLDRVLSQLAIHFERQDEINSKVKSALYYPITILTVAVTVVIFLIAVVVPNFVSMFADFGAQLPLPTRILLAMSSFLQTYWWAILISLIVFVVAFSKYKKTPRGKQQLDKLLLKIPVIGSMMQKVLVSRFASTLAILLASGVDLLSSLAIVEEVLDNAVYSRILIDARGKVREGINLSVPLSESKEFPSMVVQMIKIGEESGSIELMLRKISKFFNSEVESAIDASIALIEPAMIVFLAVVVGFIVVAIVLPMFEMFSHF